MERINVYTEHMTGGQGRQAIRTLFAGGGSAFVAWNDPFPEQLGVSRRSALIFVGSSPECCVKAEQTPQSRR